MDASPNVAFVASLIKAASQSEAATMSDAALLIKITILREGAILK